jgi:hypothetical protein
MINSWSRLSARTAPSGYWVWGLLGGSNTFGLDWIRWVISVAGAAILSFAYTAITRRGKSETGTT